MIKALTVSELVDMILYIRKQLEEYNCVSYDVASDLAIGVELFENMYHIYLLDVETGCPDDLIASYETLCAVESKLAEMFM